MANSEPGVGQTPNSEAGNGHGGDRGADDSQAEIGEISAEDLAHLESLVSAALRNQDLSELNILGFGEISVALGFPFEDPRFVCKRTPPLDSAQFDRYKSLIDRYLDELRDRGLEVVDTEVRAVERDHGAIAYLVQPLLPTDTLGHKVLAASEPHPDHGFLVALSETVGMASARISIDAQVTNWSWDGSVLTLLDVGSPFLWDEAGVFQLDMSPFLPMIPAPLRSAVRNDLIKVARRWQTPRGVALDIIANLYREGLEDWVAPALAAMNRTVGAENVISPAEAEEIYAEDRQTFPKLAKLKRVERAWQTRVRRRPYDFFIQSTYAGDKTY